MKLREAFALFAALEGCAGISSPPPVYETPEPIPLVQQNRLLECDGEPLLKPIENVRNSIQQDVQEILEDQLQPIEYIKRAVEKLMENVAQLESAKGFERLALSHYQYAIDRLDERLKEIQKELNADAKKARLKIASDVAIKGINPGSIPFLSPAFIVSSPSRENLERQLRGLRFVVLSKSVDLKFRLLEKYLQWTDCMGIPSSAPITEKLKLWLGACGAPPRVTDPNHIIPQDDSGHLEKIDSPITLEDLEMIVKNLLAQAEKTEASGDFEKALAYYEYLILHLGRWHEKAKDKEKIAHEFECRDAQKAFPRKKPSDDADMLRRLFCAENSPRYKDAWKMKLWIETLLQMVGERQYILASKVFEVREKWFLCIDQNIMAP